MFQVDRAQGAVQADVEGAFNADELLQPAGFNDAAKSVFDYVKVVADFGATGLFHGEIVNLLLAGKADVFKTGCPVLLAI